MCMESNKIQPPKRTEMHSTESERKRIYVSESTKEILKRVADSTNKKFTQGVIAYEWFMMSYDVSDTFDDLCESKVNERLLDMDIEYRDVNDVKVKNKTEYIEEDEEKKRIHIWIPEDIDTQTNFQRGWGKKIDDSVRSAIDSPWCDRRQRVKTKESLIEYLSGKDLKNIEDDIAKDIIKDNLDVPENLRFDLGNIQADSMMEYMDRSEYMDTWTKRFHMLESVLEDDEYDPDFEELVTVLSDVHDIQNKSYVRGKIRKFAKEYGYNRILSTDTIFKPDRITLDDIQIHKIPAIYNGDNNYRRSEIIFKSIQENGNNQYESRQEQKIKTYYADLNWISNLVSKSNMFDSISDFESFLKESEKFRIGNSRDRLYLNPEYL